MALNDPKRGLSDEDIKFIEDSERLTRIINTLIENFKKDSEKLREDGRKLQGFNSDLQSQLTEMKKKINSSNPSLKKLKDEKKAIVTLIDSYVQKLPEVVSNKKVDARNYQKKLQEFFDALLISTTESDALKRKVKERDYTLDRTKTKLTNATNKIASLQKEYKAKTAELDKVSNDAKLSLEDKEKKIKELEDDMNDLAAYLDEELAKIKQEDNELFEEYEKEIARTKEAGEKDLDEAFSMIEAADRKVREREYTLNRTQTKLSNATSKIASLQKEYKKTVAELEQVRGENAENASLRANLQNKLNGLRRDIIRHEIYNKFGIALVTTDGIDRVPAARYELYKEMKETRKLSKEQKRNNQTSAYSRNIQDIISSLADQGITETYKNIDSIIKDEIQPTLVKKHPFEAIKTLASKDPSKRVNSKTKKSIGLRLAAIGATLILSLGFLVSAGTTLGVNLGNANNTISGQTVTIEQNSYEQNFEQAGLSIKSGAAYIFETEDKADERINSMGVNSNGYVSLSVDDNVVNYYNIIKDTSEKTAEIITFNENNEVSGGEYLNVVNKFNDALKDNDKATLEECVDELNKFAADIGNSYENKYEKEDANTVKTLSNSNTATTYYQDVNNAWNNMNNYINNEYSTIIDLATTPVLNIDFDSTVLKNDAELNEMLTSGGVGAAKDVLSCQYERETGKVTMLVECVSMKGEYTVEKVFKMEPMLKVVDSNTIVNGLKEAGYEASAKTFDTSMNTNIDGNEVTMSVDGKNVSGQAKVLYNLDVEYFANRGEKGTTEIKASAIVMLTQEDGSVVYRVFDYNNKIAGYCEKSDVESQVLTELMNKINSALSQENQVNLSEEAELQ